MNIIYQYCHFTQTMNRIDKITFYSRARNSFQRERRKEYFRKYYAKNRTDPDWVAARIARYEEQRKDPVWVAKQRDYYEKKGKENSRKAYLKKASNPERLIYNLMTAAKTRAKAKGMDFDLEPGDLEVPTHCPILGIPLFPGPRGMRDNSFSLDRIDPSKGYIKGNVRVISFLANRLKSDCIDTTIFRKIADYIEANLKA